RSNTDQDVTGPPQRGGDRRARERRQGDRRSEERRSPAPLWRRPAAYVTYGALGTVLLVFLVSPKGDTEVNLMTRAAEIERLAMAPEPAADQAALAPVTRDAYTLAQFERLLAEGNSAAGQIVRTELYCES